jgi:hypothetical protein
MVRTKHGRRKTQVEGVEEEKMADGMSQVDGDPRLLDILLQVHAGQCSIKLASGRVLFLRMAVRNITFA